MKPISLIDTHDRRPMTAEEKRLLTEIVASKEDALHLRVYNDGEPSSKLLFGMLLGRAGRLLLDTLSWRSKITGIDVGLATFVVELSAGIAGNLVLWAWTLHQMQKQQPSKTLTIDDFLRVFPDGVPSNAAYSEAWHAQKLEGDNILDQLQVWA